MRGRQTEGEPKERVTIRFPTPLLDDIEDIVDGMEGYGRCDYIRDAVAEKRERGQA